MVFTFLFAPDWHPALKAISYVLSPMSCRTRCVHPKGAAQAGDASLRDTLRVQENATILKNVLQGKGTQQQQDVVALNAALALYVGEAVADKGNYLQTFADGVAIAKDALDICGKLKNLSP